MLVDRPPRPGGEWVLYWMTAARRLGWNHALERAAAWAQELGRPLVVLEALRAGYPWASDRLHAFVLQGMRDNARAAARRPILYHPYVEPRPGAGNGLVAALAARAAVVVADDSPVFFLPRMLAAAAARVDGRVEAVDSNGLLPLAEATRAYPTAHSFRRFLQANLKTHLLRPPRAEPLAGLELPRLERLPEPLADRWPAAGGPLLAAEPAALASLPIDHGVPPVAEAPGGGTAAGAALERFLATRLERYAAESRHPDAEAASGLSPYLHFGHLSPFQVVAALGERAGWSPETLPAAGRGAREGWWGLPSSHEAFLDELVTWRELGFNYCHHRPHDVDRYESLPEWARRTLDKHEADARPWVYDLARLGAAATHDELWNASQRELLGAGRIHNYLRMLWGKRVLEWSPTPRVALATMIELNNRYALDGRDPNSYSGILWCLGRYDRPWAPERPVFGVVRYMSSAATRRKLRLKDYLRRWGGSELPA